MNPRAMIGAVAVVIGLASALGTSAAASAAGPVGPPNVEVSVGAAWGLNATGQLGDLTWTDRTTPVGSYKLTDVAKIAAGQYHSLAVMADGTLRTWGQNGYGQLGYGFWVHSSAPKAVPSLSEVVDAAGGWTHSLAVRRDGTVWAWGDNTRGQLGDGTTTRRYSPVQIEDMTDMVAVAAGNGWSIALRSDGTVWAWGAHGQGILGAGASGTQSSTPIQVEGLRDVVAIAAGGSHALAIVTERTGSRAVFAWGDNSALELAAPPCGGIICGYAAPQRVAGLPDVAAIAAGRLTSVALGVDGSVWTWGFNVEPGGETVAVRPVIKSGIVAIAAGGFHVVAIQADGLAVGWGNNKFGQLGNGTTGSWSDKTTVSYLTDVRQVAAGESHTLALYVRELATRD